MCLATRRLIYVDGIGSIRHHVIYGWDVDCHSLTFFGPVDNEFIVTYTVQFLG